MECEKGYGMEKKEKKKEREKKKEDGMEKRSIMECKNPMECICQGITGYRVISSVFSWGSFHQQ